MSSASRLGSSVLRDDKDEGGGNLFVLLAMSVAGDVVLNMSKPMSISSDVDKRIHARIKLLEVAFLVEKTSVDGKLAIVLDSTMTGDSEFSIIHCSLVAVLNGKANGKAEITEYIILVFDAYLVAASMFGMFILMISLPIVVSIDFEMVVHARSEKIEGMIAFMVEETSCDGIVTV